MSHVNEPFSQLDVLNNFMFNSLTTDPNVSEKFCRAMLKGLLGKQLGKIIVTSEKIIVPDSPEKRGVRLDVRVDDFDEGEVITNIYDIEPHRDFEKNFPKKNRFQQAQLDKNNMESGNNNFENMPNLYIITITNYDPFGYDYMLYTIENGCIEVPELVYNDGVKIYYFNTEGTKGGTESLKNFLTYLENSEPANEVDDATKEMAKYVEYIKDDKRREGRYMTVGDWADHICAEAREEGLAQGLEQGIKQRNITLVLNMSADGLSVEKIMKYTGLDEEDVKQIIASNNN